MRYAQAILSSLIAIVLVSGCGDDDPTGADRNETDNQLVITVDGGGTVAVGADYAVCCADWEPGDERPTFKILFYDADQVQGGWKLFLVRDKVELGVSYPVFESSVGLDPTLLFFLYDPATGNELSTSGEGASGTITVNEMDCGSPIRISVTFTDVLVPSEFHDAPSIRVSGTLTAVVYENPTDIGCDFGI
jgi:hypothetical protein